MLKFYHLSTCLPISVLRAVFRWTWISQLPFCVLPPLVPDENMWWIRGMGILQVRCSSCHPTNSVKALQRTQSTYLNQWPGLVLSSSTTRLQMEGALLCLCQQYQFIVYQYTHFCFNVCSSHFWWKCGLFAHKIMLVCIRQSMVLCVVRGAWKWCRCGVHRMSEKWVVTLGVLYALCCMLQCLTIILFCRPVASWMNAVRYLFVT